MSRGHLLIHHRLPGNVHHVFEGFTRELFEALTPVLPPTRVVRYDGNAVGDIVHLQLGLWPLRQDWVSEITAHECYQRDCFFVDEGRKLPWPLTSWRHRHVVSQVGPREVEITEDISYATNFNVLTVLMRPLLYAQYAGRGQKYRRYFGRDGRESI